MRLTHLLAPLASLALLAAPANTLTSTEMALTSSDGFALKGTLNLPAAKGKIPVVILAHQFRSDRSGWNPLIERLAARGIGTLVRKYKVTREDARRRIISRESNRIAYIRRYFNTGMLDPLNSEIVLNTELLSIEQLSDIIVAAWNAKAEWRKQKRA